MKPEKVVTAIDRRALLAAAGGMGVALSAPKAIARPATAPIADAHVHVFNASDLPAGKFVQYVIIPDRFPSAPSWAAALADLVVNILKPLAVTVRREAGRATFALAATPDVTPASFGQAVSDYISQRSGSISSLSAGGREPFDPALAVSYRALLEAVSPGAGTFAAYIREPATGAFALRAEDRDLTRRTFQALAAKADAPTVAGPKSPDLIAEFVLLGGVGQLVGWCYLMCQSRQKHIDKYLSDYSTKAATPRLLVNNLVDFDRWLDDGPSTDSPHLEQVAFMATLAKRNSGKVDVRTFGGFCPLKNVLESAANPGKLTTLDGLKAAYLKGDLAGFKLYPPMGFQAYGNADLPDSAFARPFGAGEVVLKQWRAVGKGALGPALDGSLKSFFDWCAAHDAPLLAHGGPGNQAAPGFGERANPKYWELAQKQQPKLRLSIGHLVNDPAAFVKVVLKGGPPDPAVWALDAPLRMLAAGPAGTIYGDLAYTPEIIDNEALRTDYFNALKRTFGPVDPGLRHILYGTDWVFLGLENNNDNFLQSVIDGMAAAGYTQAEKDNILYLNARRFLKIDPV